MKNQELRDEIKRARLYTADVAAALGMSTSGLYAKLQRDLSPHQKEQILNAIDLAAAERRKELLRTIRQ